MNFEKEGDLSFQIDVTPAGLVEAGDFALVADAIRCRGGSPPSKKWRKSINGINLAVTAYQIDGSDQYVVIADAKKDGMKLNVKLETASGSEIGTDTAEISGRFGPILLQILDGLREVKGTMRIRQGYDSQTCLDDDARAQIADRCWRIYDEGEVPFDARLLEFKIACTKGSPIAKLVDRLENEAKRDIPILLNGSMGVGKTALAEFIHAASGRTGQLVKQNAVTVSAYDSLYTSIFLYGCEPGSFKESYRNGHVGWLREARRGTLFIDEFTRLPQVAQIGFLSYFEPGKVLKVPTADQKTTYDNEARLVAATRLSLPVEIAEGRLDESLLSRFEVFELPHLEDRLFDIPALVQYLSPTVRFQEDLFKALFFHSWPGNVRDLLKLCLKFGPRTFKKSSVELKDLEHEGTAKWLEVLQIAYNRYTASRAATALDPSLEPLAKGIYNEALKLFLDLSKKPDISKALRRIRIVVDGNAPADSRDDLTVYDLLKQRHPDPTVQKLLRRIFADLRASNVPMSNNQEEHRFSVFKDFFGRTYRWFTENFGAS